ncbi:MAG: hypothetical protein ABJA86_12400 [Nocardioidaceae bacterium]
MTDIETLLRATLRSHADRAPTADEVLRELPDLGSLAPGEPREDTPRRSVKRWAIPALAAAAVAIVVVSAAVLLPDRNGESRGVSNHPSTSPLAPQAPPGTRLVGMGRLAVAVPEGWSTNDEKCGIPLSNTVLFEANGQRTCLITLRPKVSALHIVSTTSAFARPWMNQDLPSSEVDGVTIERSPTRTGGDPPLAHMGNGLAVGALVAPSEGVVMWMTSPDPTVVDSVLDSVIVLPAGWVTIPFNPNLPLLPNELVALKRIGLNVEITRRDLPGRSAGALSGVTPAFGSVVPVGSTVHLVVDSGN